MQKILEIQRPRSLYLFAAFLIASVALLIVVAPAHAIVGTREDALVVAPKLDGNTWSPMRESYGALPAWWIPDAAGEAQRADAPAFESVFQQGPDLIISKSAHVDPVSAGGFLTYTIVFTNDSSLVANNVRITETYDTDVAFARANPPPSIGSNIWAFDMLTRGESAEISLTVLVAECLVVGTELSNQVMIGAPALVGSAAVETTAVASMPDLNLTLSGQPEPITPGATLTYLIHYENLGNAPATGTVVRLDYDSDLTLDTSDPEPVNRAVVPLRWDTGVLTCGATGDITTTMIVTDNVVDQSMLRSEAWIDSIETGPVSDDRERTDVNAPVLELTKAAVPSTASAGERLTYTLIFSNVGHADSATLVVTDAVPANTGYADCDPLPCAIGEGVVAWAPGNLVVGGKITATLAVTVDSLAEYGTVLVNTARVSEAETGAYASIAQIETVVLGLPLLQLSVSNGQESVEAGDELLYTINYANTGNGQAKDTTIVVTPPSSQLVEQVGCEPPSNCVWNGGQLFYSVGPLRTGDRGFFHMVATVRDPLPAHARSIIASAVISASSPVDPSGDTYAEDEDPIATGPDLHIEAEYEDIMPRPGKQVVYTLEYGNTGHIATTGVYIEAIKHPNTDLDKNASTPGWVRESGGRYRYDLGELDYLDDGEILFAVTLPDAPFTSETTDFDALFVIRDDGLSGQDADPDDNDFYAPLGVPNLVIERALAHSQVWEGQPGILEVVVKNVGSGTACGVSNPGVCTWFALDVFLDATVPPPSFPILAFGDCYAQLAPIDPGVKATVQISFTLNPSLQFDPGYCGATKFDDVWLKVDNWDPDEPPYPESYGLVPESEENDNVFGPFVPLPPVYLPVIVRS
jgi:uncharacterized repeat protein (TIGR01451 family)